MVLEYRHRTREQDGPVKAVIVSDMRTWHLCTEGECCIASSKVNAVLGRREQGGEGFEMVGGQFDIAAFQQKWFWSCWFYINVIIKYLRGS